MLALVAAVSDSFSAGLWGAAVSIGIAVGGRIVYDLLERYTRRERLKHALVMECFGTIRKLSPVFEELNGIANAQIPCAPDRLALIIRLPSRITVAGISQELHQLLTLLPKAQAPDLLRFTDRWSRLQLLISKYESSYDAALRVAAKCDGRNALEMRLRDEYILQTLTTLNDCYRVGNSLCEVACTIVRKYGPYQDCDLNELCEGIWEGWGAHGKSWSQFKESVSKDLLAVE
jgi:hypothetical protein